MANNQQILPGANALLNASRISINDDKPIMLDYYTASATGNAVLVMFRDNPKRKVLFKSNQEYTSGITKMGKVENDYIFVTENSIYICHGSMQQQTINSEDDL
jgi:hypothetical protein